ncbi:MAG: DUF1684 domain-containing protein [Candidatus Thorarchaeota archaeon]
MNYSEEVQKFRDEREGNIIKSEDSPLSKEIREKIKNLPFFPINEKFRIIVEFEKRGKPKETEIVNKVGVTKTVNKIGKVEFLFLGSTEKHNLEVYKDPEDNNVFTIFGDLTNNTNETYGAGRYVDLEQGQKGEFYLDFNKATSPYCSYSEKYPCPLIPRKNRLNIRIEAGEKYIGDH